MFYLMNQSMSDFVGRGSGPDHLLIQIVEVVTELAVLAVIVNLLHYQQSRSTPPVHGGSRSRHQGRSGAGGKNGNRRRERLGEQAVEFQPLDCERLVTGVQDLDMRIPPAE